MRFDPAKALATFQELGDPRFAGAEGEPRVADFVAEQFARMGLNVERRAAVGSRFPQRVGPWVGWLGYGALLSAVYLLLLRPGVLPSILAFAAFYLSDRWLGAVLALRIRPRRRRPRLETAPVVIASTPDMRMAPARVVFQVVLGGLACDFSHSYNNNYLKYLYSRYLTISVVLAVLTCKLGLFLEPARAGNVFPMAYGSLMRYVCPGLLAIVWIGIAVVLSREYGRTRGRKGLPSVDRRGIGVLAELARTWPRSGARPIEPVFVAAGGQRLDHAGSREVIRLLGSQWSDKPSLLLLMLAPGAGEKLGLFTFDGPFSELHELAPSAARSLWIPIEDDQPVLALAPWPFAECFPAVVLIGSDPRALEDATADPQALHRAAQLATEIALRWARKQQQPASATDSAT